LLINTDYHENHTANNAQFIAAGTQVMAHENVKQTLATYNPQVERLRCRPGHTTTTSP